MALGGVQLEAKDESVVGSVGEGWSVVRLADWTHGGWLEGNIGNQKWNRGS